MGTVLKFIKPKKYKKININDFEDIIVLLRKDKDIILPKRFWFDFLVFLKQNKLDEIEE
jgi:hypothetical protein